MVAHILGKSGSKPCPNASTEARKTARKAKDPKAKGKREREVSGSETDGDEGRKPAKRKLLTKVKTSLKQSQLKVFRGINVPFTKEQLKIVNEQFSPLYSTLLKVFHVLVIRQLSVHLH
jgi:hypothetical protein